MQILKKITVGGINNVRGGFKPPEAITHVARLFGIVRSVETKESNFGPYLKFKGDIRAVNEDGEESAAPVMMLPSPADGLLAEALANDKDKNGVQFAFDIYINPTPIVKPGDRGYEYRLKPLMNTEPSDPLKAIVASLPAIEKKVALPASEKSDEKVIEEKADEKKPEPAYKKK